MPPERAASAHTYETRLSSEVLCHSHVLPQNAETLDSGM